MRGEIAIVGNNVAALVAAQSLAAQGRQVALVNPAPNWGGHFAGLELDSRRFDPGMILYEFSAFNSDQAPDPRGYDPDVRYDSGRFVSQIEDYVGRRTATVLVPNPLMHFNGRLYPDLIISNQVEALTMLDPSLGREIAAELKLICAVPEQPLHASRKTHNPLFGKIGFDSVSVANHGQTLHERFFEPLCRKIMGVSPDRILALYHRAAWLPLYYPETLLSQFGTAPQRLPATQFHYPVGGSAGALVRSLAGEVQSQPSVRILRGTIAEIRAQGAAVIEFTDGSTLEAAELVWTLDPGALIALAGEHKAPPTYSKASIGLCFVAAPATHIKTAFSTLFVVDPERAIYRVTDQEVCAGANALEHRIVAEFSPAAIEDRMRGEPAALRQALIRELVVLGIIDAPESVAYCSVKILANALMIPDLANFAMFTEQHAWLSRHLPEVHLAGLSAGFHVASMNDQIVQGLKLGAILGSSAS